MKLHEIAKLTQPEHEQFKINRKNIEQWLTRVGVKNFIIDPDTNVVNVDGNVDLARKTFEILPVQFGYVDGHFFLAKCSRLKTLRGSPHTVSGTFKCYSTPISSLEGAPEIVGESFVCDGMPNLKSLSGIDKIVHDIRGGFVCSNNVTHILGLILIKGLQGVDIDSRGPIDEIMNKYVGTGDILSAQDELIDEGFIDQARL